MKRIDIETEYTKDPTLEIDSFYIRSIVSVVPCKIIFNKVNDKREIATLSYLCRDQGDTLFILNHTIEIESSIDKETLLSLPFAENEDDFIGDKVISRQLNAYLDSYVTDMKFYTFSDLNNLNDSVAEVSIFAKRLGSPSDTYRFYIPINIYSCMSFIDSCIYNRVESDHDICLATISMAKDNDYQVPFFNVNNIERIEAMAAADIVKTYSWFEKLKFKLSGKKKKPINTIGLVFKVSREVNNFKEYATILIPFDVGVEFDSSKFKGESIADIQNEYFKNSDQFVSTFSVDAAKLYYRNHDMNRIDDKEFMIIRGKTKDKNYYLFLLDYAMQNDLLEKVNEY